jgi:hypothetical protein
MGVCQELADWCFRPYHGIGPPRGAAAPFYGKVNYGKIKTLYAVLQPAGSRKEKELCSDPDPSVPTKNHCNGAVGFTRITSA